MSELEKQYDVEDASKGECDRRTGRLLTGLVEIVPR